MTDSMVQKTLKAARRLIATPDRWTKGDMAVNGNGDPVLVHTRAAFAFCAIGALRHVTYTGMQDELMPAYNNLLPRCLDAIRPLIPTGFVNLAAFNDDAGTTHANVLALYDKAVEAEAAKKR